MINAKQNLQGKNAKLANCPNLGNVTKKCNSIRSLMALYHYKNCAYIFVSVSGALLQIYFGKVFAQEKFISYTASLIEERFILKMMINYNSFVVEPSLNKIEQGALN